MESLQNITSEQEVIELDTLEYLVFEQFLVDYHPVLTHVEQYLEEIIIKTDYVYREAYIPWKKALHELIEGVHNLVKKVPLPSKDQFIDALFMFSFQSTIIFIKDICTICQLKLKSGWEKDFQAMINQLLSFVSGQCSIMAR